MAIFSTAACFLAFVCFVSGGPVTGPIEVHPPVGPVHGSTLNSRLGKTIYSFRGVRYAEPPTGEHRFKVSEPVHDWTDTFDATKEGPSCLSYNSTESSEDCLRLNIYTTELPKTGGSPIHRPVMVFFPQDGAVGSSAQSHKFGPQYMLDRDVVLVTVNWRISTLGFLSTGDVHAPGNVGMKDQVLALKWIQRNIEAFGGNPGSVTIAGYGAGAWGVILHMLSPMSKGLFHKAIAMSGSPFPLMTLPQNQLPMVKKQAELMECPIDTTEHMVTCLRGKPIEQFQTTFRQLYDWSRFPIGVWFPVIEAEIPGVERFLIDHPINLIKQKKINMVPLITGITRDEMGDLILPLIHEMRSGSHNRLNELNEQWNKLAPVNFNYERDTPRSEEISHELKKFYLKDKSITMENIQGLSHLYADSLTIFPTYRLAKLMALHMTEPVYLYKFMFQGTQSFAMKHDNTPFGIVHQDDLQYLFYMSYRFHYLEPNAPEVPMVERMTSIFANFVTHGHPIPEHDQYFQGIVWDKFVPTENNYMELNVQPVMKKGSFYTERMQELERLFPMDY